jgi:hypothetical protein
MKIVGKIIKHGNKELRIKKHIILLVHIIHLVLIHGRKEQHIILLTHHSLTEKLIILLPGPDPVPWQKGAAYHPPHSSLPLRDTYHPPTWS